jgi:Eukaryotic DNA topoisomerase I, catalytic core
MTIRSKPLPPGTARIRTRDLATVVMTPSGWKLSEPGFPDARHAVHLYKSHGRFKTLVDAKNPRFLKGMRAPDGRALGARIAVLPDGKRLNAGFSLFAKNLRFHDEDTDAHWDVMFENPAGFRYLYEVNKIARSKKRKTHVVDEFARVFPLLKRNVLKALKEGTDDVYPTALFTLIKTYMRVGNEIYYNAHHHKGLTTLQKQNILIQGNEVVFDYVAKDGVPVKLQVRFPDVYIRRLSDRLAPRKADDYVFSHESDPRRPLDGKDIKKAIKTYCGKEFYPHIIRSYYADTEVKKFFHTHRTATKDEVYGLLIKIASKLGHKRYDKKEHEWVESPKVTVNNYIRPEYVERLHRYYS